MIILLLLHNYIDIKSISEYYKRYPKNNFLHELKKYKNSYELIINEYFIMHYNIYINSNYKELFKKIYKYRNYEHLINHYSEIIKNYILHNYSLFDKEKCDKILNNNNSKEVIQQCYEFFL
ncbi:ORF MSV220 hypothetical protein [Melanoplus sanguinipes entomopoxvirus]|uniref:Uncharacterized protein n=1 Tax=Melanoplus sanguinipes entomopoxvirus TaxID=83191 RepID=Q9YVM2_MSEPV|nr:ORF MSV220 hypothetical protein [Melanoplus sanguinipes entomopoxvirus]AAC97705.1 ORF MSV220 hypothetical protein [Melanoplus sanguinipes entomopoxvirus 'O']